MRIYSGLFLAFVISVFSSCTNAQSSQYLLDATTFSEKISDKSELNIIDVRTPDEFSSGYIQNALNIDWNGEEFEKNVATLDKAKPVFVYCLSGGRSSSAADYMRKNGFLKVYELEGGIMKWRAAGLPEAKGNTTASEGMSHADFKHLLETDKVVLVDFYADWCAPCKKMKPYLEEIEKEMSETVKVVRINVEENKPLCQELGIEVLPTLEIYKDGKKIWNATGFRSKSELVRELK